MVPIECATTWMRAGDRARHQPGQHLLERVARPHRALAVVAVVEQIRLRRPGEHHGLATEADAVGDAGGVERGAFEGLVEAVHVDEHVTGAAGLGVEIADLAGRLDRIEVPIVEADGVEREAAVAWWRELSAGDAQPGGALRPIPGLGAGAVHGLAGGGDEKRRIGGEIGGVEERTAGGEHAGAAADGRTERQRGGGGCKRAQHGAAAGERRLVNITRQHAGAPTIRAWCSAIAARIGDDRGISARMELWFRVVRWWWPGVRGKLVGSTMPGKSL
jgi:hypothetical protein